MIALYVFFSGPYLRDSLKTFVIGHWSVSRQVTCRHLCITRSNRDNLVIVDHATDQPLPLEAYTWLVKHLSREGDTVIDVDSSSGSACVAALKGGRNGVWISTASSELQHTLQCNIKKNFAALSNHESSEIEESSENSGIDDCGV